MPIKVRESANADAVEMEEESRERRAQHGTLADTCTARHDTAFAQTVLLPALLSSERSGHWASLDEQEAVHLLVGQLDCEAPLALYLTFPSGPLHDKLGPDHTGDTHRADVAQSVSDFKKEMALHRLQLPIQARPVIHLHWSGQGAVYLEEADIIELMHYTSKYFRLGFGSACSCMMDVVVSELSLEKIDLLRGIGFNQLNIVVTPGVLCEGTVSDFEQLLARVAYARQRVFNFVRLSLCLGTSLKLQRHIIRFIQQAAPEEIVIKYGRTTRNCQQLSRVLSGFGYTCLGFQHFYRNPQGLSEASRVVDAVGAGQYMGHVLAQDHLSLGPGALSHLNRIAVKNQPCHADYRAALDRHALPVSRAKILSQKVCARREILACLLLLHRCDVTAVDNAFGTAFPSDFSRESVQLEKLALQKHITFDGRFIQLRTVVPETLDQLSKIFI